MSLLDEAREAQARPGPQCSVASLPADLRAQVDEALEDPTIYASTIAKVLVNRGYDMKAERLTRHRRRECRCR